ncbi:MAG: FkbM family methyltransferase [Marinibacterium sp.]|nr:FkbM family methyltransferase [Marinibacterium sp.]
MIVENIRENRRGPAYEILGWIFFGVGWGYGFVLISYAQNSEDIMLWRALGNLQAGFYIDVGAWSPDHDSVTKLFYKAGWCGINVEPLPRMLAQLRKARPNDTNLGVALSDAEGAQSLFNIGDSGLSTLSEDLADSAEGAFGAREEISVPVTTLAQIWDDHVPEGQPVHFLKIDVEGLEERVIRGADWERHRPWIVVVEATVPMTQIPNHEAWEPALLEAGYGFVWFDGLNRYYVANEHPELVQAFDAPPNLFDEARPAREVDLAARLDAAELRLRQEEARAQMMESTAQQVRQELIAAGAEAMADLRKQMAELSARQDDLLSEFAEQKKVALHDFAEASKASLAACDKATRQQKVQLDELDEISKRLTGSESETRAQISDHARDLEALVNAHFQRHEPVLSAVAWICEPLWVRMTFRPSGRPKTAVRRLLFHSSGKPRSLFRSLVLRADGRPHRPFRQWMQSAEYQSLRHAVPIGAGAQGEAGAGARPLWIRIAFRPSGKPKKAVRRLLFHTSGKPRSMFRPLILHPDGRPHSPFRRWLTSTDYQYLRDAVELPAEVFREARAELNSATGGGVDRLPGLSPQANRVSKRLAAMRAAAERRR